MVAVAREPPREHQVLLDEARDWLVRALVNVPWVAAQLVAKTRAGNLVPVALEAACTPPYDVGRQLAADVDRDAVRSAVEALERLRDVSGPDPWSEASLVVRSHAREGEAALVIATITLR